MVRNEAMRSLVILILVVACSGGSQKSEPAPASPPVADKPAEPSPAPASGPKLHEKCGDKDACGVGACVTYYGIAGARGPQFKTCEIKCDATTACPAGTTCGTIADGPGQVCR